MPRFLNLAVLSLVALPQALGGFIVAHNTCNFKFWCSGGRNDGTFTPSTEVLPGQWYRSALEATNDNVGAVLKCSMNPYNGFPSQVELNVQYGKSWLDLSAEDGDPFLAYHRRVEIPGFSASLSTPVTKRQYTMASERLNTDTNNSHFSRGSLYEKLVGETSTRLSAAALSYLPLSTYTPTTRILDSACGPGIVSKLLLSPSPEYISVPGLPINPPPQVTGIDLSESMIEQYKVNANALGWATSEAYVGDSQNLALFPDATFDAVVMSIGIFTLGDAIAGVREMHRVLKPGGHAVVTTWKTRRPQAIMTSAAEIIRPGGTGGNAMDLDPKWLTSKHLATVMAAGGFNAECTQLFETAPNWIHGSLDDLLEALSSPMWTAGFCKGWSAEEMGRWTEEVAKQLTEEEKAQATLEMVAHICVAQKEY
ncbi:hypothetical protein E0Z10_g9572 [Xylaria hypoxylon]|uniref:Methyltransferase domain-containing protein n=1 Tax=Xylaria hypoxylon TaxID=37992 RepID=A0A4Z0YIT4_9PEZI|nr:hypothetical protein E0Z10_g9572 [Xylaria hypoxylon]